MSYPPQPPPPPPPPGPGGPHGGPPGPPPPGGPSGGGPSSNTPQWAPQSSSGTPFGAVMAVIAGAVALVLVAVVTVVFISLRSPSASSPADQDVASAAPPQDVSTALQEIRDQGVVRIGVMDSPPYSWLEGTGATGSSPEVARAVFAELGVPDHDVVELPEATALRAAVNNGEIDVIAQSSVYDAAMCNEVAAADPDALHPTTFVVPSGNPEDVEDFDDVIDQELTLAAIEGSHSMYAAEEAGVSSSDMEFVLGLDEPVLEMVADGEVDAFMSSSQWLRWLIEDEDMGDDVELTEPFVEEGGDGEEPMYSGMAFSLDNEEILQDVNPVLHDMNADGRLLDLGEPFGIAEDNLPPVGTTKDDACAASSY